MRKKIGCFILALLMVIGWSVPVSATFNTETRESVAVVATCLDLDGGEYVFGWGTGFFVGTSGEDPKYLVTNYHVISDFMEYGAGELISVDVDGTVMTGRSKIRIYYDSKDYDEAYIVESNEQKDIAVLRLDSPTGKRKPLPLCSPTDDMVGSTIYAVGYPGLSDNVIAGSTTSWGVKDCSVTQGIISRIVTTEGTGVVNIQIDCDIKHGNSGGPLIDGNGAAIGINTWGVSNNTAESVNYAVSIDEVIPMLKLHSVEFDMAGASGSGGNSSVEEGITSVPVTLEPEPEPETSYGLYIIVAVLIAVIIAAVVVIVILMKKKTSTVPVSQAAPAPAVPPAPSVSQPMRTPVVRTVSGMQLRAALSPQGQQLLIGRDPSACGLAFPGKTPGVSGRHCSLSWDSASENFILTDMQSTYGTYLENGQRLAPGVSCRLRSGERFYLGEKNNMLSVGME